MAEVSSIERDLAAKLFINLYIDGRVRQSNLMARLIAGLPTLALWKVMTSNSNGWAHSVIPDSS
jgi:hypothetical protein